MRIVTVTAVRPFDYKGHRIQSGQTVDVRPIEAASLKYRGLVTLGTRALAPEPVPVVEDLPAPRRRTYRRRDLTPEP